jgi:hypothetical protein
MFQSRCHDALFTLLGPTACQSGKDCPLFGVGMVSLLCVSLMACQSIKRVLEDGGVRCEWIYLFCFYSTREIETSCLEGFHFSCDCVRHVFNRVRVKKSLLRIKFMLEEYN